MVHKSSFPPVPISNESLPEKLLRAISRHGRNHPTKKALVMADDPSKSITFHELHAQAHSVRAFLRTCGFQPGSVACLILSNCVEWAVFQLGAMAAGGAVSGASALFSDYELERQFTDSRCSVVFTDSDNMPKVTRAVEKCPGVKTIICLRRSSTTSDPILLRNVVDWADVVSFTPEYDIANVIDVVSPASMVALPYSSGTTGSPKGVMLSHRNITTAIDIHIDHFNREVFRVIGPKDHTWYDEVFIVNAPFYHMFGFGSLNIHMVAGATSVIIDKFEPRLFLSSIAKYRPRILKTVPPILTFLTKHPMVKDFDLSSVEMVTCGSAPVGKELCAEFLSKHKNVKYLCQGYGMTEMTFGSHLPILNVKDAHLGVGKAVSNVELKIIDVSTGKELDFGQPGEVCVRSPTVMIGYLNRPEATAETIDRDGWLHTGDIGYLNADGRMYIVDRLKELIKVKGLQVAPAELEDILLSHPLVSDAAVIGVTDDRMGELVRAYVVRANDTLKEEDVTRLVAQKLSTYKHITGGVIFVAAIPKSPSGKILRRLLRHEAARDLKSKM